jgi:predicted component of viral defense system (DUF524 family)
MVVKVCAFDIPPADALLEQTEDGFGLRLRAGRFVAIEGIVTSTPRGLRVRLSYNRAFTFREGYDAQGTWTRSMRPDLTLSAWPSALSEEAAEAGGKGIHVHFDAKYRIEELAELFGRDEKALKADEREGELDAEHREQREGKYKRADLLKMHAYRDAIRRSVGAYVVYPGDVTQQWRGFHELLPGLGAFSLRPGRGDDTLADFIRDVIAHAGDPNTVREEASVDLHRRYGEAMK